MNGWFESMAWIGGVARLLVAQNLLALAVVPLGFVLARIMRRRHPKLLASLWLVVMLRLLLPTDLGLPVSGLSLASGLSEWFQGDAAMASVEGALSIPSTAWTPEHRELAPRGSSVLWPAVAVFLWSGGLFVLLSRRVLRWRRQWATRRQAVRLQTVELESVLRRWNTRLGIRCAVRLMIVEEHSTPSTTGVFRPQVWIPRSLLEHPALLEAALAHELAHVARRDALWVPLLELCHLVYFFNPLVWLASSRLVHERERACDRLVVDRGEVEHRSYAHHLLELAAFGASTRFQVSLNSGVRRMTMRITSILHAHRQAEPSAFSTVLSIALMILLLVPILATVTPANGEVADEGLPGSELVVAPLAMQHPLPTGRLTAPYGDWRHPFTKKPAFHRGLDLAAPEGAEIMAAADGRVSIATREYGEIPAAGTVIRIDHGNGLASFYSHLGSLEVAVGDEVRAGQVIATVGNTGLSTGPHLHFEVWEGDEHRNPADFLADPR